jgi:hypothetical protein
MIRKPGRHLTEVLAGAKLQGSESDVGPLSDFNHHRAFAVLHQKNLLEAGRLHQMAGSRQLLLQCWQQEGGKVKDKKQQTGQQDVEASSPMMRA